MDMATYASLFSGKSEGEKQSSVMRFSSGLKAKQIKQQPDSTDLHEKNIILTGLHIREYVMLLLTLITILCTFECSTIRLGFITIRQGFEYLYLNITRIWRTAISVNNNSHNNNEDKARKCPLTGAVVPGYHGFLVQPVNKFKILITEL